MSALLLVGTSLRAEAFTLQVEDPSGGPVSGFRWLLETDNSHDPEPGVHRTVTPGAPQDNTLSISIHKSHAPVVAKGESAGAAAAITDTASGEPLPDGRYVLSVLPYGGFTMGGTSVRIEGGQLVLDGGVAPSAPDVATVVVAPQPIETAQIAVRVFHDIRPLNNAPDATEPGLAGWRIELSEAAGEIVQDAFGNPLGTTYAETCDANGENPGTGTHFCLGPDGAPVVDQMGVGTILTDADGEALIKFLRPDKYGVQAKPPTGETGWYQTTTIEGTPTIDAWVRPKEPPFLVEFGPPFWHAFYGFVQATDRLAEINPGGLPTSTVIGQVRKGHQSPPPAITFFDGAPPSTSPCLIGLNALEGGAAEAVWIAPCEDEGHFTIPGVPPGVYQLVAWDVFLDQIIFFTTVVVPEGGGELDLGTVAVPMWFGEHEHWVYFDANKNGVRDPGEAGIPEQNVNLRFRDGSIYKAFPTDTEGFVPFEEIFPFFKFQVAEVDFARFEATGLTVVSDDGGPVTDDELGEGKRNPRVHTENGPVLTEGYQVFAGQNTRYEWGKAVYDLDVNVPPYDDFPGPGDTDACTPGAPGCGVSGDGVFNGNGGISGIVFYATTRAEDDPRYAAGEEWEPGIPRVQVNLYRDVTDNETGAPAPFGDGTPDPKDPGATFPYVPVGPDVDNHPLGWSECDPQTQVCVPGPEDVDRDGDLVFDLGDAIQIAHTDSWDDALPSGCAGSAAPLEIHDTPVPIEDCSEGLRTWNQDVPAVFDGGYAFGPMDPELVPGTYVVETMAPPGYEHVKEEDRNVDFGDQPIPFLLPPPCVGEAREVPPYFSFLTVGSDGETLLPGVDPAEAEAPFAGQTRRLCDRKQVQLSTGQNAAADFFLMTDVPRAARVVGLITDDLANELSPGKPAFVEKFSPGWMPISVTDYSGKEILRTYSDEFGSYNALLPSTFDIDLPTPSGVGPQMHHICLNDPGPDASAPDPRFDPSYSTTCYSFDFWPGKTTYLDTPVIRNAAFVGPLQVTLDCEPGDGQPVIRDVMGASGRPAYVQGEGDSFTITSLGVVPVRNPAYPGDADDDGFPDDPPTQPQFVMRNFGFGSVGPSAKVRVGDYVFPTASVDWSEASIEVTVPAGAIGAGLATGQLLLTDAGGRTARLGVTLTVGDTEPASMAIHEVHPGESIQAALDAADADDLVLVHPGSYHENLILYENVRLQGAGAHATLLNATHYPGSALAEWREKLAALHAAGEIGLLPGQTELQPLLRGQEGPGILVVPKPGVFGASATTARIDGLRVRGADEGGGIFVNAHATSLEISNDRLENNAGTLGGGIRVGTPKVAIFVGAQQTIDPAPNPNVRIHHNEVLHNGSRLVGGGVAVYAGADDYSITDNHLCGNFSRRGGGGIGHTGRSDGGVIARNAIVFNEVFQGDEIGGGGGGIEIAGEPEIGESGAEPTLGSGSVLVEGNRIQGNLGGAADGGGIALRFVNGQDLIDPPGPALPAPHRIDLFDNAIFDNVSGLAGGGISLQDAVHVRIIHDTIAHNDSTATASDAFEGGLADPTTPQVAGIAARPHSALLQTLVTSTFSQPEALLHSIVWQNRSFFWSAADGLQPRPAGPYWDLGVAGGAGALAPSYCLLTDTTGYDATNVSGDPRFRAPYQNRLRTAAAADEGGNFVQVLFDPLAPVGDVHIRGMSAARDGTAPLPLVLGIPELAKDVDGQNRAASGINDIGADEFVAESSCGLGAELALVGAIAARLRRRARRTARR
ncbi:MAG: hypothetical protein DCC71_19570 [Proteobacteria bacterium]|nr:MAG: hypothetical protein DCC71_19570 [Pseudomonadota bacterium]